MNRAGEMSTTLQSTDSEPVRSTHVSIALIGPDAARRRVVAKALANSEDRTVREFAGYPASMSDLQSVLAGPCDVVMIDLDSDEHFALEIVETIASMSDTTVIVYSTREDPDLLVASMRAGARDLLPIPADEVEDAKQSAHSVAQVADPAVTAPPPSATPQRVPVPRIDEFIAEPQGDGSGVTAPPQPATPQRVPTPRVDDAAAAPQAVHSPQPIPRTNVGQPNRVSPDFNEWDRANLRPAQPARVEPDEASSRLRRATDVPAKSKPDPFAVRSAPATAPRPSRPFEAAAEMPVVFRNSEPQVEDDARKRGGSSKKWVLIVAGPVVVAGLLYFVLMRPAQQNVSMATQAQSIASVPESSAADKQPVKPLARRSHSVPNGDAAGSGAAGPGVTAPPVPASSEMMNAQLTAPSQISKEIKTPAPSEAPPAGPSLGAFAGSGLPSAVLGGGPRVRVAPAVSAISAGVAEGMLIHKVDPIYPKFARDNHMSGTVVLKAKITKTGVLEDVQMVSGPRILGPAAMDAVKRWRYRPYMLDNQPVEVETTIKLDFLPIK